MQSFSQAVEVFEFAPRKFVRIFQQDRSCMNGQSEPDDMHLAPSDCWCYFVTL